MLPRLMSMKLIRDFLLVAAVPLVNAMIILKSMSSVLLLTSESGNNFSNKLSHFRGNTLNKQ